MLTLLVKIEIPDRDEVSTTTLGQEIGKNDNLCTPFLQIFHVTA